MAKGITIFEKEEALTNFLRTVTTNKNLHIERQVDKFAIAERLPNGGVNVQSNYMSYNEMNCYFFGVLAVQNNRVQFYKD